MAAILPGPDWNAYTPGERGGTACAHGWDVPKSPCSPWPGEWPARLASTAATATPARCVRRPPPQGALDGPLPDKARQHMVASQFLSVVRYLRRKGAELRLARYLRRLTRGPRALLPLPDREFRLSDFLNLVADEISEADLTVAKLNASCIHKWGQPNPPNLYLRAIESLQAKNVLYTTAEGIVRVPPEYVQCLPNHDRPGGDRRARAQQEDSTDRDLERLLDDLARRLPASLDRAQLSAGLRQAADMPSNAPAAVRDRLRNDADGSLVARLEAKLRAASGQRPSL